MSINRRHMLTGLAVAVPTTAIASNAYAATTDAELFRLEAEVQPAFTSSNLPLSETDPLPVR